MRPTPDKMRAFMAQLRKKMNFKSLVVTLAAIVVFTTTYLLILPAFTLDKEEAAEQGGIDVVAVETAADVDQADKDTVTEETAADTDQADKDVVAVENAANSDQTEKDAVPEETAESKEETGKAKAANKSEATDKPEAAAAKPDIKLLTQQKTITADQAKGDDFEVSAVVDGGSKVPEDVSITAAELGKKTDEEKEIFAKYEEEALKALKEDSDDVKAIKSIKLYDISLESDSQDESVEPAKPVNVKIAYEDGMKVDNADNIRIVHFAAQENGEEKAVVLDADENKVETTTNANGSKVTEASFDTDGFSVFAVVETITTEVISFEDKTYEVSVSYGSDAKIPEGSKLKVQEIAKDDDKYKEAEKAVKEAKKADDESFDENSFGMSAMDISIVDADDNPVEPAEGAKVSVSIEMKKLPADEDTLAESMEIQHLNESTGKVDVETVAKTDDIKVVDGSAVTSFTIDSFSTFTITWAASGASVSDANASFRLRYQGANQYSNYAYFSNVRVWYVDENGNNLQKPTGRNDVTYNSANNTDVSVALNQYTTLNGYTFIDARYSLAPNKPNGETIDSVQFLREGTGTTDSTYTTNFKNGDTTVASLSRTSNQGTNNDTANVYLVFRSNSSRVITVHYGYMDGNQFVEFDELPDGAETHYGPPSMRGDQLNIRYDIEGKDFVTVRMGNPRTGTQISPLLQTENQSNYGSYPYWKYRILNTLTTNDGINEWQQFTSNQDLYVIYRDTPTEKSYDDQGLDPEDLSAPATNKDVEYNDNGTYDVELSVTGTSNSLNNKTHANVVVVLDTSSSMNGTDTGSPGQNRLQVAKNAIYFLAEELFGFNTADDPEAIEVAFVDFSHRVRNEMTKDTIYSGVVNGNSYNQFISLVRGLNYNGGTNYDTAIEAANSVLWDDADPVYVIFITDGDTVSRGYLEYDSEGHTYPTDWDGGTYYNAAGGDYLARARSAAKVQVDKILADSNNRFYSIGVFGNVQYLQALGGTYLGQANEQSKIEEAFAKIISEIHMELGYEDVTVNDGITAMTSTGLSEGDVRSLRYYRSGGTNADGTAPKYSTTANNGRGETWSDAPEAFLLEVKNENGTTKYYKNGSPYTPTTAEAQAWPDKYPVGTKTLVWDIALGENQLLEDGVTYTVAFTIWPSQESYDLIADLNNQVKEYDELTDAQKAQIYEDGGKYYLRTNTNATVDYTSIRLEDGVPVGEPQTGSAPIKDPNGRMLLDSELMTVQKLFDEDLQTGDPYTKIRFYLKVDDQYYNTDGSLTDELTDTAYKIDLPKDGVWSDTVYIATGLMKDGEILETGHRYTVEEEVIIGDKYEYEFTPQTVRPMAIASTDATYLVLKDKYNTNPDHGTEYVFDDENGEYSTQISADDTDVYYVDAGNDGKLTGTNRKTAELDITKVITDVSTDNDKQILTTDPRYKESFTYRVKLSVPADSDPTGILGREYVPRLNDQLEGTRRVNIYGYQGETNGTATTFAPDTTRFKERVYGAWNTQAYKYFVSTHTEGTQTVVDRDEDGNFIWLEDGDGITAAKKETIDGKDYYTIQLDVTIKMDEVYRFNNLPSGTRYEITEYYWNKYPADTSSQSEAHTIVNDPSNINESGYSVTVNQVTGAGQTDVVQGNSVSGTINDLDTRYYNQFVNDLKGNPDIIRLQVTKHLLGYEWTGERYYFRLSAVDGAPMPPTLNEQLYVSSTSGTDDKSYAFGYIRFTEPGTYRYKITELDPATAGISAYTAVEGVTGYGIEKTITIVVDNDLKVTSVTGTDTTYENRLVNTTFTNTKTTLIKLLKIGDASFNNPLSDVKFKLYSDQACETQVTKDSHGNDIGTNGEITTGPDGMADIGILAAGTYYLKETAGADGYKGPVAPITITVGTDGTVSYRQTDYSDSGKGPDLVYQKNEDGSYAYYSKIRGDGDKDPYKDSSEHTFVGYRIVVNNTSGAPLPHTGGIGTTIFYILGTLLAVGCGIVLVSRRRAGMSR